MFDVICLVIAQYAQEFLYKKLEVKMSKFSYENNEIKIAETQCDFCEHKNCNIENGCDVFGKAPDEVLTSKSASPKFSKKGKKYPWEK